MNQHLDKEVVAIQQGSGWTLIYYATHEHYIQYRKTWKTIRGCHYSFHASKIMSKIHEDFERLFFEWTLLDSSCQISHYVRLTWVTIRGPSEEWSIFNPESWSLKRIMNHQKNSDSDVLASKHKEYLPCWWAYNAWYSDAVAVILLLMSMVKWSVAFETALTRRGMMAPMRLDFHGVGR